LCWPSPPFAALRPPDLAHSRSSWCWSLIVVARRCRLTDRSALHLFTARRSGYCFAVLHGSVLRSNLRSAGVIPLHDEATTFAAETADCASKRRNEPARLAGGPRPKVFRAVLLEGLEVGVHRDCPSSRSRNAKFPRVPAQLRHALLFGWRGLRCASAAGAGSRKRLKFAVAASCPIRHLLDRAGSRRGLSCVRPRDRRIWLSCSLIVDSRVAFPAATPV